jgi:hypothetical protein
MFDFNLSTSAMFNRATWGCRKVKCARSVEWRSLREIEVGVCDGLSYEQVSRQAQCIYEMLTGAQPRVIDHLRSLFTISSHDRD